MGNTYIGECKICGEEADLILSKCEDCASKSLDYQLGFIQGRKKELEKTVKFLKESEG